MEVVLMQQQQQLQRLTQQSNQLPTVEATIPRSTATIQR